METASELIIAIDLGFAPEGTAKPILNQAFDLGVRIHNLRESQLRRATSGSES